MIAALDALILDASNFVWSYIIVGLCVVVGLFCTVRLGFIQLRSFGHAVALLRGKYKEADTSDGITTLQALSTALSSTTGIGNIAGVAVAIKLGGPGAIFWMWMMALIGMALKYVEGTLGSMYRGNIGGKHEMGGGPMYYITRGLGERWRPMAVFYAMCTAIACLGAWNMFQSNQAAATLQDQLQVPTWLTGLVLSVSAALVLIGGIKRIGKVTERLVPTMCVIYVATVIIICLLNYDRLPDVMALILREAFAFESAGGGILGTAILIGIRRALFSNEAGTGSAAIAHAAANTLHPVRQGIVASLGPFIDTIVVCAATAFVILLSGYYGTESYQNQSGAVVSFEQGWPETGSREWQILSADVPADDGKLQRFTRGESVLAYRGTTQLDTSTSPNISLADLAHGVADTNGTIAGIRFSAWADISQIQVSLVDITTGKMMTLPLFPAKPHEDTLAMEGEAKLGQWGSWLIRPTDELHASMAGVDDGTNLVLRFTVEGAGHLYVDRVEIVTEADGIVLSSAAFAKFFGFFGTVFIPIAALFFAYSTVLAGNYYGEVACHFLNEKLVYPYLWLYIAATFIGCVVDLDIVINFSDLTLGLMAIPNVIAMALLTPVVVRETRRYFAALKAGEFELKQPKQDEDPT